MLSEKLKNRKIILASGSPRRQQFFKDLGLDFEIRLKEIEEIYPPTLQAQAIPEYLAVLKSDAFAGSLKPDEILVTSDTIVWFESKALGKPKDYEDAFAMLRSMSGKIHTVYTSVCFRIMDRTQILTASTQVTFNALSDEAIRYYLEHFKPYDKAGAYGIQDWIGLVGVAKIDGSYANVMGLPVDLVYNYLSQIEP